MSSSETPYQYMTCGLKVNTQSPDWYKCLQKTLKSIKGINYVIDVEKGNALVSGRVNPYSIMKKLMKFKEHAEIAWIKTGKNENNSGFSDNGFYNSDPYLQYQHSYGHSSSGYWPAAGGGGYEAYYGGGYGQMAPNYNNYSPYYGQYGGGGYGYGGY